MAHTNIELNTFVDRPGFRSGIVTYPPEANTGDPAQHPGIEFLYVLTGRIEVTFGENKVILEPGDQVSFDAREPHGGRNLAEGNSTFLFVVAEPAQLAAN